jgi:hypothetical protein
VKGGAEDRGYALERAIVRVAGARQANVSPAGSRAAGSRQGSR